MTPKAAPRGALLLEVMLSLALFVSAGIAILVLVHQSMMDVQRTQQARQAASIARSAMARIESGIDDPQTLAGPVRVWDGRDDALGANAFNDPGFDDAMLGTLESDVDPLWELEVESNPSQFEGLNTVRVRALRRAVPGGDRITASYTLYQLVRLTTREEDVAGEDGRLLDEALRGASEEGGR